MYGSGQRSLSPVPSPRYPHWFPQRRARTRTERKSTVGSVDWGGVWSCGLKVGLWVRRAPGGGREGNVRLYARPEEGILLW